MVNTKFKIQFVILITFLAIIFPLFILGLYSNRNLKINSNQKVEDIRLEFDNSLMLNLDENVNQNKSDYGGAFDYYNTPMQFDDDRKNELFLNVINKLLDEYKSNFYNLHSVENLSLFLNKNIIAL